MQETKESDFETREAAIERTADKLKRSSAHPSTLSEYERGFRDGVRDAQSRRAGEAHEPGQ